MSVYELDLCDAHMHSRSTFHTYRTLPRLIVNEIEQAHFRAIHFTETDSALKTKTLIHANFMMS